MTLAILFEDNHCLAVAKPAPLLTQGVPFDGPNGRIDTLEAAVKAYLREKYNKPGNVYLGIPHRLDRPVSGAIVFARNTKAARRLAEQFQARQVRKTYWALVQGEVRPESGTWTDYLCKIPDQARAQIVDAAAPGAKQAELAYRVLGGEPGRTWLEILPHTGRMHQIRVQASARGWPVLGDELYGSTEAFGPPAGDPKDRVIALHARALVFLHPIRFEPVEIVAPLPGYWGLPPVDHDATRVGVPTHHAGPQR